MFPLWPGLGGGKMSVIDPDLVPGDGSHWSHGATPHTGALLGLAAPPLTSPGVAQPDEVGPVEGLEDSGLARRRPDCLGCPVGSR